MSEKVRDIVEEVFRKMCDRVCTNIRIETKCYEFSLEEELRKLCTLISKQLNLDCHTYCMTLLRGELK